MALVNYENSTSSEGEEVAAPPIPRKLSKRTALPTATDLLGPKQPKCFVEEVEDDPAEHGGRIRTFKHERGNWATHVFAPVLECADQLEDFQVEAIANLLPCIEMQANDFLHLSLSKTVVLQYHQIEEFCRSLQRALSSCMGFKGTLKNLKIYTNEERTRTFLAVQLDPAYTEKMVVFLKHIDDVMRLYRLPEFYATPSFHVSLLWCVGDQKNLLTSKLTDLQKLLCEQDTLQLSLNELHCKCGNKNFYYKLKSI